MLIEDKSTECQHCGKRKLVLVSHVRTPERDREAYVSTLQCDLCHREYTLRDGKLAEKREEQDPVAENVAIRHSELETALKRRCSECGGPVTNENGPFSTRCAWCFQEYSMISGELRPKVSEKTPRRLEMDSFYAI